MAIPPTKADNNLRKGVVPLPEKLGLPRCLFTDRPVKERLTGHSNNAWQQLFTHCRRLSNYNRQEYYIIFKTTLILPGEAAVADFQDALEDLFLGAAAFEWDGGPKWSLELYCAEAPPARLLAQGIEEVAKIKGWPKPDPIVEPLPDIDWVAENQKSFQPIRAGRFFVHQNFHTHTVPSGSVPLIVNAGTAFGTGTHATTWGCLQRIDALVRTGYRAKSALDLGCGTAILAMALAKTHTARRIVATDIDPEAIRVAAENVRLNGTLAPTLNLAVANGMAHPRIQSRAPYDLIIANILANPLVRLSRDVSKALSRKGHLILSGLLIEQEMQVIIAYRRQGLQLKTRVRKEGWSTLHFTLP